MKYILLILLPFYIIANNDINAKAFIFKEDEYILKDVVLNNFSSEFYNLDSKKYSRLYGNYITSYNCLNSSYKEIKFNGIDAVVCSLDMNAVASKQNNNFLFDYIEDLNSDNPEDEFASVNMYYHINKAHDYFLNLSKNDLMPKITTVVNFQYGIKFGSNINWFKFNGSLFIPKKDVVNNEYGYDINEDLIVMGQGDYDFSYDSDVIYREYSHAIINKIFESKKNIIDKYGLSLENVALVEALSDYFAASINNDSKIGNLVYENPRDLGVEKYCPFGMIGNAKQDSLFISSVLWRIRILLEKDLSDKIIFSALKNLNSQSNFEDLRIAILKSCKIIAPNRKNEIENIFKNKGLENCTRVLEYKKDITKNYIAGKDDIKVSEYAPGYMQYKVKFPKGKYGIKIKFSSLKNGNFLNYSNEDPKLSILFKKGQYINYRIENNKLINDADIILGEKSLNGEIILQGECVTPGDWYFQFINYGGAAKINHISLSFTDFELVGKKFENCEENLCENKDNGYCKNNDVCIDRGCVKRCSSENLDGYCDDPAKCINGSCSSDCSIGNVDGLCPNNKKCDSLGICRDKCSLDEVNGYCEDDKLICSVGKCVEVCSSSNLSGYCIDNYKCYNGKCILKEKKGEDKVSGSSVCNFNNNFKDSIYLFIIFIFTFFITRKVFSDKF